ncbi:nucleotidyltransferase domain-containing protein [Nocardia sp. alder85J]|uniref:nucleotidyltransferase domain-containing protein n=1 Tax=Nocardia sp. alder85J TaxID=2862949 RepID=UPI001CD4F1AF|nr:nucleotidyltransferase domain-containing protein [Nocardia sp. alder85J]MCX4093186.1 nucleotidyltransferase domain-containing protein [Nocardia sp. alder85J]
MPTTDLVDAATAAVHDAFAGTPVFACLTGSAATDTDTLDSDIDLLVVLPDDLPIAQATQRREAFTRNYIHLHALFERSPDLQWPGEVCYAADLDAGIAGGAFDLQTGPQLRLCPEDRPYRYWVSMGATGIPLTGRAVYTAQCATTLLNHIGYNRLIAARSVDEQPFSIAAREWAEWKVDPITVGNKTPRYPVDRNPNYLAWRDRLQPPRQPPPLDRWIKHWREVAIDAHQRTTIAH